MIGRNMNNLKYSYNEYMNELSKKGIFEVYEDVVNKILTNNPRISKKDFLAMYKRLAK